MENPKLMKLLDKITIQRVLHSTAMVGIYSPIDGEELFFQGLSYSYEDIVDKHGILFPRTVYESEHFRCTDLAMGFCSVLMNWSLWELICKLQAEEKSLHAHENDIDFDFKALIAPEELFKTYMDDAMGRYRAKFEFDVTRQRFLESDDTLASKIYFDEWSFFGSFFRRGLYDDLSIQQRKYVSEWWFAFESYVRKHYHIRIDTEDMRDRNRVLEDLYEYKLLVPPKKMSIKQFINDYEWWLEITPNTEPKSELKTLQEEMAAMRKQMDARDVQLKQLRQQMQMLTEEIVNRKAPLKDLLPKENDYIDLMRWLEDQKADGHDYYKEADNNRSKMCRNISPIVGWVVDQNSLRIAQKRH